MHDPVNRPTASYLIEELGEWINLIRVDPNPSEISFDYSVAEEKRWKMVGRLPKTYPIILIRKHIIRADAYPIILVSLTKNFNRI
jgi:hypothetical protein